MPTGASLYPLIVMRQALKGMGFGVETVLRGIGLTADGNLLEAVINDDQLAAFQAVCGEILRDAPPDVAVDIGKRWAALSSSALSMQYLTAPTLGQALEAMAANGYPYNLASMELVRSAGRIIGSRAYMPPDYGDIAPYLIRREVTSQVLAAHRAWGGRFPLDHVELPLPESDKPYFDFIQAPITFGSDRIGFYFSGDLHGHPMPLSNHIAFDFHCAATPPSPHGSATLRRSGGAQTVSAVLRAVRDRQHEDELPSLALRMGLSTRTLQRRLQHVGTNLRTLEGVSRQNKAEWMLVHSDMQPTEIGLQLGYEELSSFYHAFRDWHGCTPAEFRRLRRADMEQAAAA
jgi:AraC-like DNA-binding protein